jgi:hypothetical protein
MEVIVAWFLGFQEGIKKPPTLNKEIKTIRPVERKQSNLYEWSLKNGDSMVS